MGESPTDLAALDAGTLRKLLSSALREIEKLRQGIETQRQEVDKLFEQNVRLRHENEALHEEIRRLKGLKGKPKLKPSGMEKETTKRAAAKDGKKQRRRNSKISSLKVDAEEILRVQPPEGSRHKGYEEYVVQDIEFRPRTVRFLRERWETPDGTRLVAPLPAGIKGDVGPGLRRLVLMLYHQGQMTMPRICELLNDVGIAISKRQVVRLLNDGHDGFHGEALEVLRTGMRTGRWISVDDTGARHKSRNGYCTQIGNDLFTYFTTRDSKSRLNFLDILRAGYCDFVVNEAALSYMRQAGLSDPVIGFLQSERKTRFEDDDAWFAHLDRLGISQDKAIKVASEGALYGSIIEHGLLHDDSVILSDGAGQFNVHWHALCWVHSERLFHKIETLTEPQRRAVDQVRRLIWRFYAALKDYRNNPTPKRRASLRARFDRIFRRSTGFKALDDALDRALANKEALLVALDRPDVPLHTNSTETEIRIMVTRRKISGGTRSDAGRTARDTFLGLNKTCRKLKISFWQYLGDRLDVPDAPSIDFLPEIIARRAQAP